MSRDIQLRIRAQPNETACGCTCLQALYRFHGEKVSVAELLRDVPHLEDGGTLDVALGAHALDRGYAATIYTYNLSVFDPTWFGPAAPDLASRLQQQALRKPEERLQFASERYLRFLSLGGRVRLEDLTRALIRRYLTRGIPILTSLNATYLYRTARVLGEMMDDDDIRGQAVGHFVVLCGYDGKAGTVRVADPYRLNPYSRSLRYDVPIERLICAVLLGTMTYDGSLLILERSPM